MKYLLFIILFPSILFAQNLPAISDKVGAAKKFEGYFTFYWDENAGKIWLEVQQDKEFLYIQSLPSGLGSNDIGLDRGLLGESRIVKFNIIGRKALLVEPNLNFRALTNDLAEKRAVEQSFAQSILWGFIIEAASNGKMLVDATEFFIRDVMKISKRLKNLNQGNFNFDKSRSAIFLDRTKNFTFNTEIEAIITLVNSDSEPGSFLQSVTPSSESISLRIHHSFVQLPDDGYQPREFDPRSGFNPISYLDYSTPVSEPIEKFYIKRHRLIKKDPRAVLSEAIKPIIYYLDNGTPEPIRSALMEGAQWWDQAFEAAGFKNAFQVKLLPENADPMDIRYNVINWVHRSTRGWSYGASVVDPRTGEIIKGHVSLGSLRVRQDYLIAQGLLAPFKNGIPENDEMLKMALARLKQLSAHEVGHTLGLMHNYASSTGNRASVMDYPHPLAILDEKGEISLMHAYDDKIGAWDKSAITWGYRDLSALNNGKFELNKILTDATKGGLHFISDRDARSAGGMHPQAHLWDNGNNATIELKEIMKVRSKALQQFGENNIRMGMPMAKLEEVLVPIYFYNRYQLEAASKIIGGLYYSYALKGDGQLITQAVPKLEQINALDAIMDCLDPKMLELSPAIIRLIPPLPAGYEFSRELFKKRTGLAFDALSPAEAITDFALSFLFNAQRLNRMIQFETTGNGLGIGQMLDKLIFQTWKAKRRSGMEKLLQVQTEQILLTHILSASINENLSYPARSIIQKELSALKTFIEGQVKLTGDEIYAGHLIVALERIKTPEKSRVIIHKEMPPGAPIGCDFEE